MMIYWKLKNLLINLFNWVLRTPNSGLVVSYMGIYNKRISKKLYNLYDLTIYCRQITMHSKRQITIK